MHEKRLGKVIGRARKARGFTQQALCNKTGLSYSTLAKIERGAIRAPSVFTIQNIASTLGMGIDELMESVPIMAPATKKKTSKNGVRFVYFDMNGCLVRNASRALSMMAKDSGVSQDIVETTFWQFNDDLCRGAMTIDELNQALTAQLNMSVDYAKYCLEAVEITPGVSELVEWVGEHYHMGILTNTAEKLVAAYKEVGTLPFGPYDTIIDSSKVHALKPEKEIFEIAQERSGLESN
ncbi:MAG: cro/C1-type protein, partial [Patescibacteria group bacterium]|nr:cro/C1-type protein [Patescibacteria group bacterium]